MKWLLRPSNLVLILVALALTASALAFWPREPVNRAFLLPLQPGDQEVVWLYPATNAPPWERFVSALAIARKRLGGPAAEAGFELDDRNAFPDQTTTVAEVSLRPLGSKGWLRFRWYKITSNLKTQDWVAALAARQPPPLAVIGGGTSDLAIDLARALKVETDQRHLGDRSPLLLLTQATADAAAGEQRTAETSLNGLYPGRTFRFCFTNKQMAEAVTAFIWNRADLRPDAEPFYVTFWKDDPYSTDLNRRFCDALRFAPYQSVARDWLWRAGTAALGGAPVDLADAARDLSRLSTPYYSASILYSVGAFARPNRWEADEAQFLMDTKLDKHPRQRRPLLVVPAATQPARRFLRALVHTSPVEARRFVIATGDSIAFNTILRDRNMAWPIQDLPYALVMFCHRNPIDAAAGFPPEIAERPVESGDGVSQSAGTEDLLLFVDIVDAFLRSCGVRQSARIAGVPASAAQLQADFARARWSAALDRVSFDESDTPTDRLLFDGDGNRRGGTGEHVVLLRPSLRGRAILPESRIEVCAWQAADASGKRTWRYPAKPLVVRYEGYRESETGQ